ncbi:MAG: nicotinate-nucleotide adenylyltransferase [Lachnospiraceae bacterium]|nr:nicotinate-nucleotide adenylyltransferase [Lachnospiraceae bacterium]
MTAVGIMGGTFNPIHNGHIKIAKAAYQQYHLDEVWFMPNHIPGYKDSKELLDGQTRLNMVALAIKKYPYFKASDYELRRSGKTYTAETMELLKREYPKIQFYFIIGADSLDYFDKWREPEKILQHAKILTAPRDDVSKTIMQQHIEKLHKQFGKNHFYPIDCSMIDCSSSEIRKQIATHLLEGYGILQREMLSKQLNLDPEVLQYIEDHHLYQNL